MKRLKDHWELGKEFYILDGKRWTRIICTLRKVSLRHYKKINELKQDLDFYNDTQIKAITIRDEKAGIYNNCTSCNLDFMIKDITK